MKKIFLLIVLLLFIVILSNLDCFDSPEEIRQEREERKQELAKRRAKHQAELNFYAQQIEECRSWGGFPDTYKWSSDGIVKLNKCIPKPCIVKQTQQEED